MINFYLPTLLELISLCLSFLFTSIRIRQTTNGQRWPVTTIGLFLAMLGNGCLRREICLSCWHYSNVQSCTRASIMQVVVIAPRVIWANRYRRRSNLKTDRTTVISHVFFSTCACPPTYWISPLFFSPLLFWCIVLSNSSFKRPSFTRHLCSYQIIWICMQATSEETSIIYVHSFLARTPFHLMCLRWREREDSS